MTAKNMANISTGIVIIFTKILQSVLFLTTLDILFIFMYNLFVCAIYFHIYKTRINRIRK